MGESSPIRKGVDVYKIAAIDPRRACHDCRSLSIRHHCSPGWYLPDAVDHNDTQAEAMSIYSSVPKVHLLSHGGGLLQKDLNETLSCYHG